MNILKSKKTYIIITLVLFIAIFISVIILLTNSLGKEKLSEIEEFPESYRPYLEELSKKHPNWKFKALYTNLDWNYVIDNENVFGKNLVPKNYNDRWKNTKPGEYNVEVDSRMG